MFPDLPYSFSPQALNSETPQEEVEFASSGHNSLWSSEANSSGSNMFCPHCFEMDGLFSHQGPYLLVQSGNHPSADLWSLCLIRMRFLTSM